MRILPGLKVLALSLACLLVAQQPAGASQGDSSKSDSGNSSKGSSDQSKGSQDSSQKSADSTQHSPENSTKGISDYTTKNTSRGQTGHVLTITGIVLLAGLAALGVVGAVRVSSQEKPMQAQRDLGRFLRRYHPLVLRDVLAGEGDVLAGWAHELGLTEAEQVALRQRLGHRGTQEALLEALQAPVAPGHAAAFAASYCGALRDVLTPARLATLVHDTLGLGV